MGILLCSLKILLVILVKKKLQILTELGELGSVILDLLVQVLQRIRLDFDVVLGSRLGRLVGDVGSLVSDGRGRGAVAVRGGVAVADGVVGDADIVTRASVDGLAGHGLAEGVEAGLAREVVDLRARRGLVGQRQHPDHRQDHTYLGEEEKGRVKLGGKSLHGH